MSKMIYSTTNYSQFKLFRPNRHVTGDLIKNSIEIKNLLSSHPIIVTPEMYVFDGQNRLQAAKELGLSIYYIIDENVTIQDIPLSQTSKPWQIEDYHHFYIVLAQEGHLEYKAYLQLDEIFNFCNLQNSIIIYCVDRQSNVRRKFKEGKFQFSKGFEKSYKLINCLHELVLECRNINDKRITANHHYALFAIINQPDYDHKKMLYKIKKNKEKVIEAFEYSSIAHITHKLLKNVYERYQKNNSDKFDFHI